MCRYCDRDDMFNKELVLENELENPPLQGTLVWLNMHGSKMKVWVTCLEDEYDDREIFSCDFENNYCPACGRKLSEVSE